MTGKTDIELMQQALEALEFFADTAICSADTKMAEEGIAALRAALAEQKPVLQDIEQYRMQMASISAAAIGYWKEDNGIHPDYDTPALRDVAMLYAKYDALYKAQPEQGQLEWQGAFFDAVYEAWHSLGMDVLGGDWNTFASTLEAKLKEKNV